ncbi:MAG: serine hydrolase domain-containing protein, partial [Sphingopyxis sp.]
MMDETIFQPGPAADCGPARDGGPAGDAGGGARLINRRLVLAGAGASLATALPAPATAARARRVERLDRFLSAQWRAGGMVGMAVGVARGGRILFQRGYGHADRAQRRPFTPNTVFHIASITKTITAAAAMQLVQAGQLQLDAPINRYLDFAVVNPAHPNSAITARHLLMHLSSLSDQTYYAVDFRTIGVDSRQPLADFLRAYLVPGGAHYSAQGSFAPSAPSAAWDYSNVGYALLGHVVERITGEDLRTLTQRRIFAPLSARHIAWSVAALPPQLAATPYDVVDGHPAAIAPLGSPDYPGSMVRASL